MEIKLENVSYRYKLKYWLKKVNLNLHGPDIIGIIGDQKTLLLEILDGRHLDISGTVKIGNMVLNDDTKERFHRKVALIEQEYHPFTPLSTVEEEADYIFHALEMDAKKKKTKLLEALKIVGLKENVLPRFVQSLSSGEKKRLQIALGLLSQPKVLLFDEPMVDLDSANQKKLLRLWKILREKYKKTILISSNDTDLLYENVNRCVVLQNHTVVLNEVSDTLFQDANTLATYHIAIPRLVQFTLLAKEKGIRLFYHKDIRDIIKDIYKHV